MAKQTVGNHFLCVDERLLPAKSGHSLRFITPWPEAC
jgi:hypothetical protein